MGGGRRGLVPQSVLDEEESKKGFRKDGKNLIEEWKKDKKERGGDYAYVWNRNDLLKTDLNHTDFLLGLRPDPSKEDLHDVNYRQAAAVPEESSTHSGEDVGIWAYGPHDHLFNGVHDQSYVAHALAYAACVGSGPTFCGKNNIRQPSRRNNVASNNNWSRRRNWRG
ncbi:Intestinal-type alkaline phosphatase 1 [Armadillidium vulgare]|nr:Intestinal-type alkaline phosphatase 1 [Armadillidium vulgare]